MVSNSNNETQVDNLENTKKKTLFMCWWIKHCYSNINVYVTGQN